MARVHEHKHAQFMFSFGLQLCEYECDSKRNSPARTKPTRILAFCPPCLPFLLLGHPAPLLFILRALPAVPAAPDLRIGGITLPVELSPAPARRAYHTSLKSRHPCFKALRCARAVSCSLKYEQGYASMNLYTKKTSALLPGRH